MIHPTIGRVVLVRSTSSQIDPYPALVTKVWSDTFVNVAGFNDGGTQFSHSSCRLLQDDEPRPEVGAFAEWMPYQKAQAEKHAADVAPSAGALKTPPTDVELPSRGARVTPADIKAELIDELFFTAREASLGLDTSPDDRPIVATAAHRLLTICVLTLRNGFTVTGESACAAPENFDAEIGKRIARQAAVAKVWPLLGFRLRDQLAQAERA